MINSAEILRKQKFLQTHVHAMTTKKKVDRVYKELMYGYEALRYRYYNGVFKVDHYDPELVVETMNRHQRGVHIPFERYAEWCMQTKGEDWHIGVFAHDLSWVENFKQTGSVSKGGKYVTAPLLWMDIDRPGDPKAALQAALDDAQKICEKLPRDSYCIMQSGNKGVHIAITTKLFAQPCGTQVQLCGRGRLFYNLAHKIAGDVRWGNGLIDPHLAPNEVIIEKYMELDLPNTDTSQMRQVLETIDPNLYAPNSTIRAPHSIHEKTGKQKQMVGGFSLKDVLNYRGTPTLIHLLDECYEVKEKPNKYPKVRASFENIDKLYSEMFPGEWDPTVGTWLGPFYNPFYEDTHPSVNINTETGFFLDFGAPSDYRLPFWKVWSMWYKVSEEEAKEAIK